MSVIIAGAEHTRSVQFWYVGAHVLLLTSIHLISIAIV